MRDVFILLIAAALAGLFYWQLQRAKLRAAALPEQLFGRVRHLFTDAKIEDGQSVGTWILVGTYEDHPFQLKAIVDTLAARKLPSLWLMVTLPELQPVKASLNLMMRPSGATTFSNFDFLPGSLATPAGFPLHAVIRTDDEAVCPPVNVLSKSLALFHTRFGKEFLVSPQGLRIVVQVAEVDRVRYGVFREANFGDTVIDADVVKECLDTLLSLQDALRKENV